MPKNIFQSACALVVALAFGFFAIHQSTKFQDQSKESVSRMPQSSVNQIYLMLEQVEKDLHNPQVFNRDNAIAYIKTLTESAYNLDTDDIYPDSPEEQKKFAGTRKDWMERLFRIQLLLREKMLDFQAEKPLAEAQVAAFRNGNMYLSYAQDFVLMEWSQSQDLTANQKMFASDFPITLKNPNHKRFQLNPGDVILVRGGSFISATIARTGDYLSNYSHVAMVIQDPQGNISVAEALMQEGIVVYDLDKYLSLERLSRATVLRPRNSADGKAAALAGFEIVDKDLKSPVKEKFDMLMDPNRKDKTYCFKLIKQAYQNGTKGKINLPTFPMTFRKALAGNSLFTGMGNTLQVGAAPDDAFFQPEFDVLMVQRDISKLKTDWAFDVAMSSIFEFIHEKYDYKSTLGSVAQAKIAYFLNNDLKIPMKQVPPGVSADVIRLVLDHKIVTTEIQTYLMKIMDANPKPMAYKELQEKAKAYLITNQEKFFVPCAPKTNSAGSCGKFFK